MEISRESLKLSETIKTLQLRMALAILVSVYRAGFLVYISFFFMQSEMQNRLS